MTSCRRKKEYVVAIYLLFSDDLFSDDNFRDDTSSLYCYTDARCQGYIATTLSSLKVTKYSDDKQLSICHALLLTIFCATLSS